MGKILQTTLLQSVVEHARQFYERRWMWGTAGNLSVKLRSHPQEIAITASGLDKGTLRPTDFVRIRGTEAQPHPKGLRPSAETLIHQAIYEVIPTAGAVFHVHPIYTTLISGLYGHPRRKRSIPTDWIEMMKGIGIEEGMEGEIPIFPNWQEVSLVAQDFKNYVLEKKGNVAPVLLLHNHGMTAWGSTPEAARNHLEITEFICQYLYLRRAATPNRT